MQTLSSAAKHRAPISKRAIAVCVRASAFIVLAMSLLVLTGWTFDIAALKAVAPGLSPMKPLTAVNFLLGGFILLGPIRQGGFAKDRTRYLSALTIIFLGAQVVVEYATGLDFGIDRILFTDDLDVRGTIPGRMSFIASTNFVLFGVAWFAARHKSRIAERWFVATSAIGLAQSILAILGYLFGAELLYKPIPGTSIALHTAAAFLFLFVGVAGLRPDLGWMARITSHGAGGPFVRSTASAIIIGVPLIGWLRLQGELAGYYDGRTGLALFATSNILLLLTVTWIAGRNADRSNVRRLERRLKQQSALAEFGQVALASDDFGAVRERAVHLACEALGTEYGSLTVVQGLPDRARTAIFFAHGSITTSKQNPGDALDAGGLAKLSSARGTARFSELDDETKTKVRAALHAPQARNGLIVSILHYGNVVGHIAALSHSSDDPSADDAEFLARLADFLSVVRDRQINLDKLKMRDVALESAGQGITITDENGPEPILLYSNPAFARMLGYEVEEIVDRSARRLVASAQAPEAVKKMAQARAARQSVDIEVPLLRKDGTTILDRVNSRAIVSADSELLRYVGIHEDITDRHIRERQLRDVQKMQAITHFTSGVAHEFNNLLAVVISNAGDIRDELKDSSPLVRKQIDLVSKAAARAAELVNKLLTFSREQEVKGVCLDLNIFADSFADILKRVLGADFRIEVRKGTALPLTKVDPGQLETALMNLAFNSRDAMPNGGEITLATDVTTLDADVSHKHPDVAPGTYVLLTFADTGEGMSEADAERAFLPFFTTKEVGAGTGLGLSMVYGFVHQSNGHIRLQSERGVGTTVSIYLPAGEEIQNGLANQRDMALGSGESLARTG
jgi:PAS domain S-box-containing protein